MVTTVHTRPLWPELGSHPRQALVLALQRSSSSEVAQPVCVYRFHPGLRGTQPRWDMVELQRVVMLVSEEFLGLGVVRIE